MATDGPENSAAGTLGSPDPGRSGVTIDEAIETAEVGSQAEGEHTLADSGPPGESRIEQLAASGLVNSDLVDGESHEGTTPPGPGPGPADIGSGGAQRIVGARISDRISAGEEVPDGPPFDSGR